MDRKNKFFGFSLFELMITLVILAILVAIAIPVYRNYVMRARRSDGIQALLAIQIAEEKYRLSNSTYGTLVQVWSGSTSSEGYYSLSVSAVSASTYTITASAIGNQANDTADGVSCATLTLTYSNGTTAKSPSNCWQGH